MSNRSKAKILDSRQRNAARRATAWRIALLVTIVGVVFSPVFRHDFLDWDDRASVQNNPDFNPPRADSLGHYWSGPHLQFYVPVTYTVLWMVAHVAGSTTPDAGFTLTPGAFHAFNWLMHVCNAGLVFVVLRRLVGHSWAAWIGAAFFALHPVQVEPVSWVSSMYSSLSGLFALLATWQYLRYSDAVDGEVSNPPVAGAPPLTPPSWKATTAIVLSGTFYLLGLLTKPSILMLPAILALIDVGLRGRRVRQVVVPLGLMTLCLAAPIAIVTSIVQPASAAYSPSWLRPFVAGDTISFYLYKTVLPIHLIPDYGRSPRWLEQQRPWLYMTLIAPAALTLVCAALWRRSRWPAVAFLVWGAALFPMLGLKAFDYQRYSTVADRYLYFAMIAPAMLVAAAVARWWGRPAIIAAVCLLGTFAVLSFRQTLIWRDSRTLFTRTLAQNPNSLAAQSVFAYFASREGRADDALQGYRAALKINPGDPILLFNIGNLHMRGQRWREAVNSYNDATEKWEGNSEVFANLAVAYAQLGQPVDAINAIDKALTLNPRNADAHLNAAIILTGVGQFAEAKHHFTEVIRLNGNVAAAERGLAALNSM